MLSLKQRFWRKVDRRKGSTACWTWKAYRDVEGYGRFALPGKQSRLAHRVAYELKNGELPEGMVVMHTCDNPPCVNPAHLKIGTQKENVNDRDRKGRRRIAKVLKRLQQSSVKRKSGGQSGEDNGMVRLRAAQVLVIRQRCLSEDYRRVAEDFHVSSACVWDIMKNRTWKHLDEQISTH